MIEYRPRICSWLDESQLNYQVLKFSEPVYTVEQSANQSGVGTEQIIKSMLLVDDTGNFVMACVPGNKKIDATKIKKVAGFKSRPHFASAADVETKLGLKIGAVSALYAVNIVPIYFDEIIKALDRCSISAGEHEYEILFNTADLIKLINPKFADISKD